MYPINQLEKIRLGDAKCAHCSVPEAAARISKDEKPLPHCQAENSAENPWQPDRLFKKFSSSTKYYWFMEYTFGHKPEMAAPADPIQTIFDTAIRDFKADLKNDKLYSEISKATTIEEVYDVTDKLQEEQAKNGHLRHLSKIEPYLEGLRNYASIIQVFMQAKPEILALLWGPIKLLLQWASTLKQSFDAIINTTADIGVLLPEFRGAVDLFSHNEQIKDVLVLFFKDILDFYLIALKFFSLSRGFSTNFLILDKILMSRLGWKYFFESLWPRHRDKINVVMNHIERHTLLMRNEVRLEHIQAEHTARLRALEHFERTERSHRQQEYHTIETGISPTKYDTKLDWLHGRVCEGTGRWLMNDPIFVKWLDPQDTSSKVLWLQGIPGAGEP